MYATLSILVCSCQNPPLEWSTHRHLKKRQYWRWVSVFASFLANANWKDVTIGQHTINGQRVQWNLFYFCLANFLHSAIKQQKHPIKHSVLLLARLTAEVCSETDVWPISDIWEADVWEADVDSVYGQRLISCVHYLPIQAYGLWRRQHGCCFQWIGNFYQRNLSTVKGVTL